MGQHEKAASLFQRSLDIQPTAQGCTYLAWSLSLLGKIDQAIPCLERAMKVSEYCCYFFPHFNLGRVYLFKGQCSKALAEFEEALKIGPNYLPALLALEYFKKKMQKGL